MTELLDPSTALETLNKLPIALVILKDEQIIWVNQQFCDIGGYANEQLLGISPNQSEDEHLSKLFENTGNMVVLETLNQQTHLLPETISLSDQKMLYVFQDVTETIKLKQDVEKFTPKDGITGLYNKRIILENLASQVTRSRRYGNPLALLRLSISGSEINTAERMKAAAEQLKDRLRWADCLGTLDEQTILIILPETCLEEARELAAKLVNDRAIAADGCTIQFGITAWQKGDDPARMLQNIEENQDVSTMALLS